MVVLLDGKKEAEGMITSAMHIRRLFSFALLPISRYSNMYFAQFSHFFSLDSAQQNCLEQLPRDDNDNDNDYEVDRKN